MFVRGGRVILLCFLLVGCGLLGVIDCRPKVPPGVEKGPGSPAERGTDEKGKKDSAAPAKKSASEDSTAGKTSTTGNNDNPGRGGAGRQGGGGGEKTQTGDRRAGHEISALSFTPPHRRRPVGYPNYPPPPPPPARRSRSSIEKVGAGPIPDKIGLPATKDCFLPRQCDACHSWCVLAHEEDSYAGRLTEETVSEVSSSGGNYMLVRQAIPTSYEFTVAFWVRWPYFGDFAQKIETETDFTIFSYYASGDVQLALVFSNVHLRFDVLFLGQTYECLVPDIPTYPLYLWFSSWIHVALTYSAYDGQLTLYMNGQRIETKSVSGERSSSITGADADSRRLPGGGVFVLFQSIHHITPSGELTFHERGFVGCVYDFNMFSIALPQEDVALMYNNCERLCGDIISWSEQHLFDPDGFGVVAYKFEHRCCGTISQEVRVTH